MPSSIVLDSSKPIVLTTEASTDAIGAITRGLAEIIAQLELRPSSGRKVTKLAQVTNGFAEPETFSAYPSACVYALDAEYDDNYALNIVPASMLDMTATHGEQLFITNEIRCRVSIELWCQDTKERSLFVAALEKLSSPTDFMSGMRIQLPHYHNTTCSLTIKSIQYEDSEELNSRRYRKALITFDGTMCVFRTNTLPKLNPRTRVIVQDVQE